MENGLKELPEIKFKGLQFGDYFYYGTDKNSKWQFFNPYLRKWDFLKIIKKKEGSYKHSVLLRDGWIIRKVGTSRKIGFYYLCNDYKVESIKKNKAEILGTEYSSSWIQIIIFKKQEKYILNLNSIIIPSAYFSSIIKLGNIKLTKNQWTDEFIFQTNQIESIQKVFKKLRIKAKIQDFVTETKKEDEIDSPNQYELIKLIPDICKLAYSDYLKRESNIENFIIDLANEKWDNFRNKDLREKLEYLSNLRKDNDQANSIFNFVIDKLPLMVDWKDISISNSESSYISGINIESEEMEYQQNWSRNYFKISFPDLENCFYLPTTLAPNYKGTGKIHKLGARLLSISTKKWRLYPYFGKIINTGTRKDFKFEESNFELLDESFLRIIGIPSIERILILRGYIDSFNVDFSEWKGTYLLNRQFVANVKILSDGLDNRTKTPCSYVEDIFGNKFLIKWDLETYFHYKDLIHDFKKNGWISLLLKSELNVNTKDILLHPIFETVEFIGPKFITKDDAYKNNFLALMKYFRCLSLEEISHFWDISITDSTSYFSILEPLLDQGRLVLNQKSNRIYYNYNFLEKDKLILILESMNNLQKIPDYKFMNKLWFKKYALLYKLFPIIHPLIYSQGLINLDILMSNDEMKTYSNLIDLFNKVIDNLNQERNTLIEERSLHFESEMDPKSTFVGDKAIDKYISHALSNIRKYGCCKILARGRWISKASKIITNILDLICNLEPNVVREDKITTFADDKQVPEVNFKISLF